MRLAITLSILLSGGAALAQQSDSYGMERVTLSAAGAAATSPSFGMRVVLAEQGPAGGMASLCGAAWISRAGFLSLLAGGPVPVELTVDRPSIAPLAIELSWSGTDEAFDVRRAFDAGTIGDPGSLYETVGACGAEDASPTDSDLIFYLVLPAGTVPARSPR